MPTDTPTAAIPLLRRIGETEEKFRKTERELALEMEELRRGKKHGTVVFFDLKGSTKYRRRYGPELGLHKAYLHNITVSQAVTAAGGQVAKWLGDGVLGYFADCGDRHPFLALRAALAALADLQALNALDPLKRMVHVSQPTEYVRIDHEIHTKVAIGSGELHFFDLTSALGSARPDHPEAEPRPLDPMGSCVDLAARLSDLAEADVIVIDKSTFWGPGRGSAATAVEGPAPGVCAVPEDEVSWRPLQLQGVRETVYVPHVTAFLVGADRMAPCRTVQAGGEMIRAEHLVTHARRDRDHAGQPDAAIVYALRPVRCNVAGFESPVEVLALTLEPHPAPIGHAAHDWDDPQIRDLLAEAERLYRSGESLGAARQKYAAVLAADPRNFQANVRFAMLARADRDSDTAMRHLMAAKESDPTCPLAWAVAGMTHLDDYLRGRDRGEGLVRAVTGFTRAKALAARGFHGLLEQYCTALLAISHLLAPYDANATAGKRLIDELACWPPKNSTSRYAIRLAEIFLKIRQRDPNALADVERLREDIAGNRQLREEAVETIPYDHVIRLNDVTNLLGQAEYLAKID